MPLPVFVPDEATIVPLAASSLDEWSLIINLDATKDWSGSSFVIDPSPLQVDDTHKGDPQPYLVVYITPTDLRTLAGAGSHVRWNLAENLLLACTFLSQNLTVVAR